MKAIRAIYENGVFRPLEAVDLPEQSVVSVEWSTSAPVETLALRSRVLQVLAQRFDSGETDVAERHNEHQP